MYYSDTINMIINTLTYKQEKIKTQKEKNIILHTQILIKSSKIIEQDKITLLDMKSDLTNEVNLMNIKDLSSYKLVNCILQINCIHKSMQSFRKLVKSVESKE